MVRLCWFVSKLNPSGDCALAAALRRLLQHNQWNCSNPQRCDGRWWNHYNAGGYEELAFFYPPLSQSCRCGCLTSSITVCFAQPQRGERHGGWRRNCSQRPEKETSPFCLTWSGSDLIICCCLSNCMKYTNHRNVPHRSCQACLKSSTSIGLFYFYFTCSCFSWTLSFLLFLLDLINSSA